MRWQSAGSFGMDKQEPRALQRVSPAAKEAKRQKTLNNLFERPLGNSKRRPAR